MTLQAADEHDLEGTAGGRHEWTTRYGPSTVTVLSSGDECLVAHELLHVRFLRTGFPYLELMSGHPSWMTEIANLVDDLLVHKELWRELRDRGVDDSSYWATQLGEILSWGAEPEPSLSESTQTLANGLALADFFRSCPGELAFARERCAQVAPETYRLAVKFLRAIEVNRASNSEPGASMRAVVAVVDDELDAAGAPVGERLRHFSRVNG